MQAQAVYTDGDTAINILVDDGNISGKYLSYEQILDEAGLSTDDTDAEIIEKLYELFTLTDDSGNSYYYGTDYYIAGADEADEDTGEHATVIKWRNSTPATNSTLTLTYTGRGEGGGEVFSMDVTRSNVDSILDGISGTADYSYFEGGTTTITQGTKTFYEGIDFEVTKNEDSGLAQIEWKTGTDYEWYYPNPGQNSKYNINLTTADGSVREYTAVRNYRDTLDLREQGFTKVGGSLSSVTFGEKTYDLTNSEDVATVKNTLGLSVKDGTNGAFNVFNFDWSPTSLTTRSGLPAYSDELTVSYEYNENTFALSDDSDGDLLAALGLDKTDGDHYTAAQDAILILDGESYTRSSNNIGEAYDNELIKGMTINLKGVGEVSLDVAHDAQKAVESIQTLVDGYNDLMSWINTRMTESQVDEDAKATIDSDDFRMRWGLLHGDSLLRNTKSQMRSLISNDFTFSFTNRTSSEEIYGTMQNNGLRSDATLRLRIGSKYVDVNITPYSTLQSIVDMISDSTNPAMRDIYYGDDGRLLDAPLLKASIENDKLVITSTNGDSITMSGTAAMKALKMNYTYKGLYQIGIETTSDDYGKSGELVFDPDEFMTALEDNPDEVQELMLMFANNMDSWIKSMTTSSASGETKGTLSRQIDDLDTRIASIDEYLEKYQDRLDRMEESLRTRYANSETQFAKLSQQANSIASILNMLNGQSTSSSSES